MVVSQLEILLIKSYRGISSPIFAGLDYLGIYFFKCRFEPSCSQYAEEAIKKYGAIKGTGMAIKRISKCCPGHGGYDPVR
ncbi:membrane protein insertion efficiency factor YidD [Candidatus Pacearchaeota archaeon]|nr:membrane protein insertion efficiency factor YidD [Candidatus Pacearchaeota archaeon]